MAIKIKLKNSVTQDAVPTGTHLPEVGELAVNANINSIGGYMRASDNSIVKIFGPGSVSTPAASTTASGIAELATSAETTTGTDTARVCTPAGVKAVTDAERTTSNSTYLALSGGTLVGVLQATAGSNSAPAIHFGDSDSGIYGGTNTVSLAAGGTQGLSLNSSAYVNVPTRLGIGVAAPAVPLHVIGEARIDPASGTSTIRFSVGGTEKGKLAVDSSSNLFFETAGTERARIDASGRLLVGLASARTLNSGYTPPLQVEGNTATTSSISAINNINQTGGPSVWLGKSRGAALGGVTTVQSGDELGSIFFNGADGTDIQSIGASIVAKSNGTVAGNRMPGELLFATTADSAGSVSPTTRLTIGSDGKATFAGNVTTANTLSIINTSNLGDAFLYVKAGEAGASVIELQADEADDDNDLWRIQNAGDSNLTFRSKESGSWVEKLGIAADGDATFAGTCTATSFIGGLPITNGADNRVITASSSSAIQGEANLIFDGSKLDIDSSAQNILQLNSTHSDGPNIELQRSGSALGYFGSAAASISGGTATDLALRAQGNLVLATNGGNERLRLTSVGEVIINDSAKVADSLFGIKVDPSTHNGIGFKPTSNGTFGALRALNSAGSEVCNIQYDTTNAKINFRTSNTPKLTITSGGNVGIGTTSPGSKFTIANTSSTDANTTTDGAGFNSGTLYHRSRGDSAGIAGTTYSNQIISSNGTNVALEIYTIGATGTPVVFGTNSIERMRIEPGGNVGLGGTSPNYQLHCTTGIGIGGHGLSNQQLSLTNQEIQSLNLGVGYTGLHLNKLGAHVHIGADNSDVRLSLCSTGTAGQNTSNWIRGEGNVLSFNAAAANSGGFEYEIGGTQKFKLSELQTGVVESKWNSGYATYADDAVSSTYQVNTNALVLISAWKSPGPATNYPTAIFHMTYTGGFQKMHQSHDSFRDSNTDGYICVYKSGNGTFVVKNRIGIENRIAVTILHFQGV